jgi:hypothetical protein
MRRFVSVCVVRVVAGCLSVCLSVCVCVCVLAFVADLSHVPASGACGFLGGDFILFFFLGDLFDFILRAILRCTWTTYIHVDDIHTRMCVRTRTTHVHTCTHVHTR